MPGLATEASAATTATKAPGRRGLQEGCPYAWGSSPGRAGSDCPGLTLSIPSRRRARSCRAPPRSSTTRRAISARSCKAGDPVFFHSGSYVYDCRYLRRSRQDLARPGRPETWSSSRRSGRRAFWYGRVR
ncbi:hypothetical protein LT493_32615 [Streptomyces tricolor]|nr:hypothetical protein [Streptomyces tricolor]